MKIYEEETPTSEDDGLKFLKDNWKEIAMGTLGAGAIGAGIYGYKKKNQLEDERRYNAELTNANNELANKNNNLTKEVEQNKKVAENLGNQLQQYTGKTSQETYDEEMKKLQDMEDKEKRKYWGTDKKALVGASIGGLGAAAAYGLWNANKIRRNLAVRRSR